MMNKITDKSCGSASGISYAADDGNILSGKDLATRLNGYFTSVISVLSPLDLCMPPFSLPSPAQPPTISASAVQKKLLCRGTFKGMGPDRIPTCIWKQFAPELAEPVTSIFNSSVLGHIPNSVEGFSYYTCAQGGHAYHW